MKFILIAAVAFCAVVVSDTACPKGQSGSSVTVCTTKPKRVSGGGGVLKNFDDAMCTPQANSNNECITITGGPWMSGFSTGKNTCKVYSRNDCRGSSLDVNEDGRFDFYKPVLSFRCNCRAIVKPTIPPPTKGTTHSTHSQTLPPTLTTILLTTQTKATIPTTFSQTLPPR